MPRNRSDLTLSGWFTLPQNKDPFVDITVAKLYVARLSRFLWELNPFSGADCSALVCMLFTVRIFI